MVDNIVLTAVTLWVGASLITAVYGRDKRYPFFPLFVASLFVGFPVVLLVITIAVGPKQPKVAAEGDA